MPAQADDITSEVAVSVQVANITETGVSAQVADSVELGASVQEADITEIGVSAQVADITSFCFFVLFTAALEHSSPLEGSIDRNGLQSFIMPFDGR